MSFLRNCRLDRPGALLAAVVVAPLAALRLPFRPGLWVQGGLILALLVLWLLPRLAPAARAFAGAPGPVRAGLLLYAGAAIWGGAVGVLSHNPIPQVAGQCASMLLLPMGFLAFAAAPALTPASVVRAFGVALAIAVVVTVAALLAPGQLAAPLTEAVRLGLRNDLGFTTLGTFGLLIAVAWFLAGGGAVAALMAAVSAAFVVAGMSRGAWAASLVGVVTAAVLLRPGRGLVRTVGLTLAGTTAAAALVLALAAAAGHRVAVASGGQRVPGVAEELADPANLRMTAEPEGTLLLICSGLNVVARGIEIDATVQGSEGREAVLVVVPVGREGELPQFTLACTGAQDATRLDTVLRLPAGTERINVMLHARSGSWSVEEVGVRALAGTPAIWLRALRQRLATLATARFPARRDGTLDYRIREWRAVRAEWADASAGRLLAGHGLGAQFAFTNSVWNERGARTQAPIASYIHNYYVFLGFKLGVAGIAALAGVLMIVAWTAARPLALRRGPRVQGWFIAAATALWVALLLWSNTSPQILDFRVAPLLGALVAASCHPAAGAAGHSGSTGREREENACRDASSAKAG